VLTKAELEGLPLDGSLKDDVEKGKVREPYSFKRQASIVNKVTALLKNGNFGLRFEFERSKIKILKMSLKSAAGIKLKLLIDQANNLNEIGQKNCSLLFITMTFCCM
jgi:hypothetical protein